MSAPAPTQQPSIRGIVKQVISGDSVIIRGQPKGGPPPEKQVYISNINAPRLARRPGNNVKSDEKDEPWAWEAREFLRKKLVGNAVVFVVESKLTSGREYGTIYLGKDVETGENITEALVAEGLGSVRREGKNDQTKLIEIEEAAKTSQKGKWGTENESHIRDVTWQIENVRSFLDKNGHQKIDAVVEHVRDGSTVRAFLLPSFNYVTIMLSGIKCPGFKLDNEGKPDPSGTEPHADESKFFTESRLLQRDVQIILESVNNMNFIGSVMHPNGNIAELLLKEGFARCIDWSMGSVTGGPEKLRAAEKLAKEKKLKIWKDYQINDNSSLLKGKDKEFVGTVVECVNADALVVKLANGTEKKIFFSSIRPPRIEEDKEKKEESKDPKEVKKDPKKNFRPLFEVPYMFEAREYLRKKLIGKKVHVTLDYIQPASVGGGGGGFPEKTCCTVKSDGVNIGESLVSKGFAKVFHHRQDDDQRASEYDALLLAEAKAVKAAKGIHGKEKGPTHHIVDISGDATKAKQFLPFFKRAGKTTAVVEFVTSGSRLRLFVPREMRVITFLLAGISCPRGARTDLNGQIVSEAEPYGDAAYNFTKDLCRQREVEIEVDTIDKAGNFIGWLWIDGKNLSVNLAEEGLSGVHFSAERSPYYHALQIAEGNAKARRENMWKNFVEEVEEIKPEEDKVERKVDPKVVVVTEVSSTLHFFVQYADEGDKLEGLMNDLRNDMAEKPPISGAYTPRVNDLCIAKYSADGEWYRAKVEKELPSGEYQVLFVDYGNRENVTRSKCSSFPNLSSSIPAFAKEYVLACVALPNDEEYAADSIVALRQETMEGRFLLNVEYRVGGIEYASLIHEADKADIAQTLIKEGLLMVENRKERRLQKLVKEYKASEQEAKDKHFNMWRYGDITEDDAREFGLGR